MGDPIKALELYRAAQTIFSTERHRDAEIGALRNIGIARAVDLGDLDGALEAFTAALKLAQESSDTRGIVQAALYRAEVFRRLGKPQPSESDFQLAFGLAQQSRLIEEQWKAQFGLGKLSEAQGRLDKAQQLYREAIGRIESMRAGMRLASLRSEFLADKRDVYDSLIALELRQPQPPLDEIFSLMERSRARAFEERSRSARAPEPTLQQVQAKLPRDTVFVEFCIGSEEGAALWLNQSGAGIVATLASQATLQNRVTDFAHAVENGGDQWKRMSLDLGRQLLAGIPTARHMIIAPDGPLAMLPFEILTPHDSGPLLIEQSDVSYTPAARMLLQAQPVSHVLQPWRTQLVAYGDPPVSGPDAFAGAERWQPLAEAADEIRSIAGLLPGRSMIFLGAEARKHDLMTRRFDGISLLHFTTHAIVDPDNPDRSRILMASDSTAAPLAYLFLQEVYGLDLKGVDLATISACETALGKILRGDGPQAFNQAFLAAGARATVTSLWRVPDRPTAAFMKQFYFFLAQRQPKSDALRSAKLQFLRSNSAWNHPRYWSAFVMYGDGANPSAFVIPWHWFAGIAGLGLLAIKVATR
jgi:CHAT domain-containing protein/tetratricopeptide (TPR) repeat protein